MNPLGLNPERFVVVEDTNGSQIVGVGQLQPQDRFQELRTLIVQPDSRQGPSSVLTRTGIPCLLPNVALFLCLATIIAVFSGHCSSNCRGRAWLYTISRSQRLSFELAATLCGVLTVSGRICPGLRVRPWGHQSRHSKSEAFLQGAGGKG